MAIYAVVNAANFVGNVAVSDSPLDVDGLWVDITLITPQPGIGWVYVNGQFSPPAPPPTLHNVITKVAMITRFTDAEFVAVLSASKTDVEVEGWYARFSASTSIDLDDVRTNAGVMMLVDKNLLTAARANEILTAPVQPSERP